MSELYGSSEARNYLSLNGKPMAFSQFRLLLMEEKLKPDLRAANRLYFSEETLKDAKKKFRNEEDYILEEIYDMILVRNENGEFIDTDNNRYSQLSMRPQNLNYHFKDKRRIEPTGKRGKFFTYSIEHVKMVVKSEEWVLRSDIHGLQQLHFHEEHQSSSVQSERNQETDP